MPVLEEYPWITFLFGQGGPLTERLNNWALRVWPLNGFWFSIKTFCLFFCVKICSRIDLYRRGYFVVFFALKV
jgi:hypothetical protein